MIKKISIVVSIYNEEGNIIKLLQEINLHKGSTYDYEIIFVNDGSSDNSQNILEEVCKTNNEVKLITFTRNYGHEIAMSAGMDFSKGDAVIFMDADLQHPPFLIKKMVKIWESGKKIVLTKRIGNKDESFAYKVISRIFYKLFQYLSDGNMRSNSPDFRLIDRYYIDILIRFKENSRLFRGLLYLINSESDTEVIEFSAPARFSGETKYNFTQLLNLSIDSIVAFSIKPLRIFLILSVVIFLISVFYGIFIFLYWTMGGVNVPGFTTQILLTIILGSANLLVLSVVGEYVGRIHLESKKRPLYTVKEMINFHE